MSSNFITRNDQLKGALLMAAIDAGFRLAVKNNKLYIVDMLTNDLGGFPLAIPVKFTGEGFKDLDVVQWGTISPEDSIEPVFRTMHEVVHGEPPEPVMITVSGKNYTPMDEKPDFHSQPEAKLLDEHREDLGNWNADRWHRTV
jgi:hypothetical protein